MGDVLTTLLEKTGLGQRQGPRVGGGGSSDSSSNKVLASLHFLGKGIFSNSGGEEGQSTDADPCEPDSDLVAHTSREAASFLIGGTP